MRLTSRQTAAEALTGVNVFGRYLHERFWPAIHRQADDSPHPGYLLFATLAPFDLDKATRGRLDCSGLGSRY